jgi:uncharacterized protein YidB (DUF937 family)
MSGLDQVLGGLLGGKGGNLGNLVSGLGGGQGLGGGNPMLGMLLPIVGGLLAGGGLQKILSGFHAQGLRSQADSWIGTGSNQPVTGDQVKAALGDDQVAEVAQKLGVSHDEAAAALAEVLPKVVDHASPEGQLKPQAELDSAFEQLKQSAAGAATTNP